MSRPKKDPNAVTETYQQIADRIKSTGALSPALTAALDEVTVQLGGLEDELKKAKKQFKALTVV
jgi:hypothetical protein